MGIRDRRPGARNGEKPTVKSSVKPSQATNDNLIDRTRIVWQPRLGRDLDDEDARQVTQNVTGFFGILAEWSRAEKHAAANDAAAPTKPIEGEVRHES